MKKRIVIAVVFLACGLMLQAKNYVVCVGISDYPGTDKDLRLCANDAKTMRNLFEKNGDAETVLLTDDQANTANILKAANLLFKKAGQEDRIVFFFSGHGSRSALSCYDRLMIYEEITSIMEKSKALCKMVFADACYSGNARKEKSSKKNKEKKGSVMFFLSSRSDETSAEFTEYWQNGVFTAYLERGLRGGADADKNKIITARELFLYVNRGVSKIRKDNQHPVMWGRFDHNMPVMTWK